MGEKIPEKNKKAIEAEDEALHGLTPEEVLEHTLDRSEDNVRIIREQDAVIEELGFDPLTGAMMLKPFEEALNQELGHVRGELPEGRKGERAHPDVALMFIDLDHFKVVNDTFGHAIGDKILKSATQVFMHSLRHETDKVGRKGGDEFVVMLPGADQTVAERVANKILEGLRGDSVLHHYGITASIGISTSAVAKDTEGLMESADQAMYRAKKAGRNQVSI